MVPGPDDAADSSDSEADFVFCSSLINQGVEPLQKQPQKVGEVSSMIQRYDWRSWSSGSTDKGMSELPVASADISSPSADRQGHVRSRVTSAFIVDSGASNHIVKDIGLMQTLDMDNSDLTHSVRLADGSVSSGKVKGRGIAVIKIRDKHGRKHKVYLKNVLYMPTFSANFFSVKAATRLGASFNFKPNSATIQRADTCFPLDDTGDLYQLHVQ